MSIWGTTEPQFIALTAASGYKAAVELDYANLMQDEPVYNNSMFENVLTRERKVISRLNNWKIIIKVWLWKYADPHFKFNHIAVYLGEEVYVYKHRNGNAYQDSGGADAVFNFSEMDHSYFFDEYGQNDILTLTFESKEPVSLAQTI